MVLRDGSRTMLLSIRAVPRAKKACVEEEPHLLAEDDPRLLTEDEQDIYKIQCEAQMLAKLVKYFADGHEDSDLDFDPNSDNLDFN